MSRTKRFWSCELQNWSMSRVKASVWGSQLARLEDVSPEMPVLKLWTYKAGGSFAVLARFDVLNAWNACFEVVNLQSWRKFHSTCAFWRSQLARLEDVSPEMRFLKLRTYKAGGSLPVLASFEVVNSKVREASAKASFWSCQLAKGEGGFAPVWSAQSLRTILNHHGLPW